LHLKYFFLKIVKTYLLRVLLLVVAVQILNLSVYAHEFVSYAKGNTIGETNQIDSLIEYVAEVVLDYKNAFPENGTLTHPTRTSHQLKHSNVSFNLLISVRKNTEIKRYCGITNIHIPSKEDYKYLFEREIIPPPPKA